MKIKLFPQMPPAYWVMVVSVLVVVTSYEIVAWTSAKAKREQADIDKQLTVNHAAPLPPATANPTPFPMPQENPLILSVPVSAGRMTVTFASWKDMQTAETRLR